MRLGVCVFSESEEIDAQPTKGSDSLTDSRGMSQSLMPGNEAVPTLKASFDHRRHRLGSQLDRALASSLMQTGSSCHAVPNQRRDIAQRLADSLARSSITSALLVLPYLKLQDPSCSDNQEIVV